MMRPPKVAFIAPREESGTRNDAVSRRSGSAGDSTDFTRSDEGYFCSGNVLKGIETDVGSILLPEGMKTDEFTRLA